GSGNRRFPDRLPGLNADSTIDAQALLGLELANNLLRRRTETPVNTDGPSALLQLRLEGADALAVSGVVAGVILLVRRLNTVPVALRQRELRRLLRLAGRLRRALLRQLTDNLRGLGRLDGVLACETITVDARLLLEGLHSLLGAR